MELLKQDCEIRGNTSSRIFREVLIFRQEVTSCMKTSSNIILNGVRSVNSGDYFQAREMQIEF